MRRNLAPGCISSNVKLCQRKPIFLFFRGPLFLGPLVFFFFLSPAKVGSLEMQPGAKLQAYLGVSILQPHACTQRFRLRILRRTRSDWHDMILLDFAWCCMVLHDFGVLFMFRADASAGDAGDAGCGDAGGALFSRLRFCTDVTLGCCFA